MVISSVEEDFEYRPYIIWYEGDTIMMEDGRNGYIHRVGDNVFCLVRAEDNQLYIQNKNHIVRVTDSGLTDIEAIKDWDC